MRTSRRFRYGWRTGKLLRPDRLRTLVGIAALLLVAGCGLPEGLPDFGRGEPEPEYTPKEIPTELHPGLRDCAPEGSTDELSLADANLADASWQTPGGFSDATNSYYEDNPVEDLQWMWAAVPQSVPGFTLDVVSVNYYEGLAWGQYAKDCRSVPLDAVWERLETYRVHIGAEALSDPEMVDINGYPAMKQDLRLPSYDYEGYWLFSVNELLHVYCQWENASAEAVIREGCQELINSVVVPD